MKQEVIGWHWHQLDNMQIICILLQTDNHASTSSLNFLQAGCSWWCQPNTNTVKALKAKLILQALSYIVYYFENIKILRKQIMCGH